MKNSLKIILLLGVVIAIIYMNESHIRRYLDAFTAEEPKEHLNKVEKAIEAHDVKGSLDEINLAIQSMSSIEDYTDSVASAYIEKSIAELENLKVEIEKDELIVADFKHAYYEAYSSMAYANLRLSELEFEDGTIERAYEHFNNCFSYLKSAMKYVPEPKKEREKILIRQVNEILESLRAHDGLEKFDFGQMNTEMEQLMK